MTRRRYGLLLAGCLTGCTATSLAPLSPPPEQAPSIHDHLQEGLSPALGEGAHPCGIDVDLGDGHGPSHERFLYDALDRVQTVLYVDATGAPTGRTDYQWDNAGHVTQTRDAGSFPGVLTVTSSRYDTLGRLVQIDTVSSDLDPMDSHQIATSRTREVYADFDDRGKPALATRFDDNVDPPAVTQTTSFGYDGLGRTISIEARDVSGSELYGEQIVYDDAALEVRWERRLSIGIPDLPPGYRGVDKYDADGHHLSRHQENLRADGSVVMFQDMAMTWDGDRELSEVTSISPVDHAWVVKLSRIFHYQCDAAPSVTAAPSVAAAPSVTAAPPVAAALRAARAVAARPGVVFHDHR